MIRKFLHEIVREALTGDYTNREKSLKETIEKYPPFAEFVDLTFNLNYDISVDKNYNKDSKLKRDNAGYPGQWYEVVRIIRNSVIKGKGENYMNRVDRILETCNKHDVKIILCALKKRSIQYINPKRIYELFPNYLKKEN